MRQVRLVRIARGIHSYELAALLGINPNTWRHIELGRREPPPEVAHRASQVLGMAVEDLFRPCDFGPE